MSRKSKKHKSSRQKSYSYTPPKRKSKSRKPLILGLIFCIVIVSVVLYSMANQGEQNTTEPTVSNKVLLRTSMGNITIELFDDMPITTGNFKNLVQKGVYNNNIFHRVIDGFMIQGGADPSIPAIEDEFTDHNRNERGTVAMANAGPNTGSCQFFINLVYNEHLDNGHPVFGRVIDGMDVVDAIGKVETDLNPESPTYNKPLVEVTIIEAKFVN